MACALGTDNRPWWEEWNSIGEYAGRGDPSILWASGHVGYSVLDILDPKTNWLLVR